MNKRLLEIEARKREIRGILEKEDQTGVDLGALETELRALDVEKTGIEQRQTMLESLGAETPGVHILGNPLAAGAGEKRGLDAILEMPMATPEQAAQMRSALFAAPEYRTGFMKTLMGRSAADLSEAERRALTTAAGSGGAAVPTTTYDMIIKRMQQTSALFGKINKTYIAGNVSLPVANPQTAALWTDTAPEDDNDDTVGQVVLGAYALSKFAKVKGQLIIMAIDAFESYVVSAVSDQLAIAVENVIPNGTGVSQPTGILTGVAWDATNSATWEHGANVGYDDLVAAKALLALYRSGPNVCWIMNGNMEAQIYKIKSTTEEPLFTTSPLTGLIAAPLGFPVVVDYYMPDNTILLANLDYYYMNINQNPTILADDSAGFLSTSRVFRGTMFCDAKPAISAAFVKLTQAAA